MEWYHIISLLVIFGGVFIAIGLLKGQINNNTKSTNDNCQARTKLREEMMAWKEKVEGEITNVRVAAGKSEEKVSNIETIVTTIGADVKKILISLGADMRGVV